MSTDARRNGAYTQDLNAYKEASPDTADDNDASRHRRGYQACERCRSRKVKCDLGSVDAPHSPPCARCRRENKSCEFAQTRKKRKTSQGDSRDGQLEDSIKRGRTSSGAQDTPSSYPPLESATSYDSREWTPQHSLPALTPQYRLDQSISYTNRPQYDYTSQPTQSTRQPGSKKTGNDVELRSQGAQATLSGYATASTHDNMLVLMQAANATSPDVSSRPNTGSNANKEGGMSNNISGNQPQVLEEALSPIQKHERDQALKAWRRMRFVRAGWFTPEEAMELVEYFYARLQPMSPVITSDYRPPRRHLALLSDEPILALTILAISSRHYQLRGHAHLSRSYLIHEKLWNYLRSMVQRLLWAQEQFGGGFYGGGSSKLQESPTGQITWKGSLRTLGTIEALLLLTDWQPRALHFPPGDDENRLLDLDYDQLPSQNGAENGTGPNTATSDTVPYASWLEPAWRSDKMSWMLIGLAQALSFELGVFDINNSEVSDWQGSVTHLRKQRIRRLVLVYVSQTSGRMCVPSPLRLTEWGDDFIGEKSAPPARYDITANPIDIMHGLWVHIASIMNKANREIFPSREHTRQLTSTNGYKKQIAIFTPLIAEWERHFNQVKSRIDYTMQQILLTEYEYARLYINSLGLQNVVESWVGQGSSMQKATMVKIADDNKKYIDELTDAALHILEIVVDGLGRTGFLRDAPVRTFLRTLSGMMFTLKRLSLGNHEKTVRKCLDILDRACVMMAQEVVDDVHLSSQTSRLVKNIVKHVKQTLIRVQKPATSGMQSNDQSRAQSPQRQDGSNAYGRSHAVEHLTNNGNSHSNLGVHHSSYSDIDPLAGIQARPMSDLLERTFMPPPNFNFQTNDLDPASELLDDSGAIDPTVLSDAAADWFALPLDNLWNDSAASVDQGLGGIGPTVGPRDMLEVITNQDYNQLSWNPPHQSYHNFNM